MLNLALTRTGWGKKFPKLFLAELCQISTKVDNFWHSDYVRYIHCPPHLIYVNELPCEMQMLHIVE